MSLGVGEEKIKQLPAVAALAVSEFLSHLVEAGEERPGGS